MEAALARLISMVAGIEVEFTATKMAHDKQHDPTPTSNTSGQFFLTTNSMKHIFPILLTLVIFFGLAGAQTTNVEGASTGRADNSFASLAEEPAVRLSSPKTSINSLSSSDTSKPTEPAPKQDQRKERSSTPSKEQAQPKLKGFIDENGDGIDDRVQRMGAKQQGQMQMRDMMRDRFIDMDGDGINDDRCSGMGITPSKRSKGHGKHN